MTLQANARLAGFTYLFYIAVAFPQMTLENKVTRPEGIPAKLLAMAQNTGGLRLAVVLGVLAAFVSGPLTKFMWLPVAAFELIAGPWLLIKGVRVR